jgi:Fic family protein
VYVPPPPGLIVALLSDFEQFIHAEHHPLPPLVRIGLLHAQFETIHPFLDGNGRIGRLLIAALIEHWGLLAEPLLYLSGYLKRNQQEYYGLLSATRAEGDWEAWIAFFLDGVAQAADDAERNVVAVASLIAADRRRLLNGTRASVMTYRLFEMLPTMPRFGIERARRELKTSFPTASKAVELLVESGILTEMSGQRKHRSFGYQRYIELLSRG